MNSDAQLIAAQTASSLADKHPILLYGFLILLALIAVAKYLPGLITDLKASRIDGDLVTRITTLEEKSAAQDVKIHEYAVKITRLTVIMIRLEALLLANGVKIPDDLVADIEEMRAAL